MGFSSFVDMATTPQEVKEDLAQNGVPGYQPTKVAAYPYGLCITLTNDEIARLDLDTDCCAGDLIDFRALAKVTSKNEREMVDEQGNKTVDCRIELQIVQMAVENKTTESPGMDSETRARGRYGAGDAAGPADDAGG